jgi:prepilin-type N-terminal cleavage/methylation domain-containing protein
MMKQNRSKGLKEHWSAGKPDTSNDWKSKAPKLPYSSTLSLTAGLTLLEVMLAIVILGIGAGTLLTATARCMAIATKARHYSTAHRLLLRVNTEKPLARGEVDEGIESGSFEDGYTWEREILKNEKEDREGLYTVRTRVSWSTRGRNAFEETTSYLYIPPEEEKATPIGRRR